jgi:predicted KAP-like P-loop ATPase
LNQRVSDFKSRWNGKDGIINDLASGLVDIMTLASVQGHFYIYRQDLVDEKNRIMSEINLFQRDKKGQSRLIIKQQKGLIILKGYEDSEILPRNKEERDILMDNFLKNLDFLIDQSQNFMNMITDTISTIDKMIFGIPYSMELNNYRQDLKT